jgi:chromosome partitioning protein
MTKILSCVNLKGGVGKTALAVNFAAYCGATNRRTLLIDLDPQTNATFSCIEVADWEAHAKNRGTVADILGARSHSSAEGAQKSATDVILKNVFSKVDLLPSHLDLFSVDLDLSSAIARETLLRRAIQPITGDYDVIICDCPPNLTIPTQNALALSTHYAVPISPDYLSGIGLGLLLRRVTQFSSDMEHPIINAGIVISRVGRPAIHREMNVTALRERFKDQVLVQEIHERVAVSEAAATHVPIYSAGDAAAAQEFSDVSEELLQRLYEEK